MSRAYRIAISERLRRRVDVEDGVRTSLELLAILPPEQMAELLAAELEAEGFTRDGDRARRDDDDGVEVVVDLAQGTVTARLAGAADLDLQREGDVVGGAGPKARSAAHAALRAKLEDDVARAREELREEVTARLEQRLGDVQQLVDGAVDRATARALKVKAAQLGEIEEISEDAETGELTIRVRL